METLINAAQLAENLDDPHWLIFDCRFSLEDPDAGCMAYGREHVPGAVYVDMNRQLSAPHVPGVTGRHPLPDKARWIELARMWGLEPDIQAIVYDDAGGVYAARMWWMLRWIGHRQAAVLDGGWQAWKEGGFPVSSEVPAQRDPSEFDYAALPAIAGRIEAAEIDGEKQVLIDARDPLRFTGEKEPIDPVAGHIPGAHCSSFSENLQADGHFKSPGELRKKFHRALAGNEGRPVVSYCGSGITASHNILAMKHAGFDEPLLYAGSWSEWITDPGRPVATGE